MKRWIGWTLGLLTLIAACSDDDDSGGSGVSSADVARVCNATCSKLDECQLLSGLTQEDCVSQCTSSSGSASSCQNPPSIDGCVSALESAACADVANGTAQQACACQDGSGGAGQGGNGGSGATGSGATGSGATGNGATCADLQGCCNQIADASQKEGCDSLVTAGNDSICGQTLSGFVGAGICTG